MKKSYSSTLFSQIVSTIETAINMNIDCKTYDQLAEALNMQGFTNSRGKSFTGGTLQKYLHRIRHPKGYSRVFTNEFEELHDEYFPNWIDKQDWSWSKKMGNSDV